MLQKAKVLFVKVFMVLLALSFISWGANSYFTNTPRLTALSVNGENVPASELETQYNMALAQAQRQFGSEIPAEMLKAIGLGNKVLDDIVRTKLTLSEAKELGFRSSDKALMEMIKTNPSFQDADGNFNMEAYKRTVASYGYTVSGYEKLIAEDMTKRNLYALFETNWNAPSYLKNLYEYQNEKMTVRVLNIDDSVIGNVKKPTIAEIKEFHEANAHRFLTEETRDLNVLVLRADKLKDRANVTAEDIRMTYDDNPEQFATGEERRASHILVSTEEKAVELIDLLDKGADFAKLATTHSTDAFTKSKGGDLGFFLENDMVDAFSEAAFAMQVGEVSEPVKSPFGYHIIKLVEIQAPEARTFEEVKAEIEAELRAEQSEDIYFDLVEQVEDMLAGGSTLTEVATALNLNVDNYKQVKANSASMTFATDIMPVAFETEENATSEMIEIAGQDTVSAYVEVAKVAEPRELTVAESQERIVAELTEVARQKAIGAKAEELLVARQSEKSLATLAAARGIKANVSEIANIGRTGTNAPVWLKERHINLLFAMNEGDKLDSAVNTDGGMALVELVKREKTESTAEELEMFQEAISRQLQEDLFAFYMLGKRQQADVEYNEPTIKTVMGKAYGQ